MTSGASRRTVWWSGVCGIGLLVVVAVWTGARVIERVMARGEARTASAPTLPALGGLPPFALTERSHRVVTLADLRGFVWVATFFFSRCGDTCPLQVARMAALDAEFSRAPRLRMVAITVDPAYDTPTVLSAYADHLALDRDRFLLLTGERGAIAGLAQQGFRLAVGEVENGQGDGSLLVAHSDRLALVDGDGQLRGTYPTRDPEALERLRGDLGQLLDVGPAPSRTGGPVAVSSTRVSLGVP
jgi:cytochrome oxidase Cu insertion factor (SCO1/SenC/PrrC family)